MLIRKVQTKKNNKSPNSLSNGVSEHGVNGSPLTIGRLANAADVNVETIRHYQRKGLIIEPVKPMNGFRYYSVSIIDRIRFIKRAQQLGFSLSEIKQLLVLGDQHCEDIQLLAIEKRNKIQQQIAGLLTIQTALDDLISTCRTPDAVNRCGFIDGLSQKGFLEKSV